MTAFADSSALVKLYVPEADHQVVRGAEPFVVSHLARVEVTAALWRKHRMGEVGRNEASLLATAFDFDFLGDDRSAPRFAIVGVDEDVIANAVRLLAPHNLRAYDAVQLASALVARRAVPDCETLVAFDDGLRHAALAEGLAVLPPL